MKRNLFFALITLAFTVFSLSLQGQGAMQTFKTSNSPLVNNDILAIDYDSQGRVWIGTNGGGISVYDNGSWSSHKTSNSNLINDVIKALYIDAQDNVWVGTPVGVSKYNGSSWTSFTNNNSGLSNNNVRSIGYDSQGNVWFGTSGNGADKYNGSTFTNYSSSDGLAHNFVQGIAEDQNGNMWFATSQGVSRRSSSGNWTTYDNQNVFPADAINMNDLTVDSAGHIWTGASKGLSQSGGGAAHYDQSSWTILKSQGSGLVYNDVMDVSVDFTNAIWFATNGGGASYYDYQNSTWVTINNADGLPNNNVKTVGFDKDGNTWMGTKNGLVKYSPIKVKKIVTDDLTCDTTNGSIEVKYSSLRNDVYFSIDSGQTYSNSNTFAGLQAGNYQIMVTDSHTWVYGGAVTLSMIPVDTVSLGPDTTICQDESLSLDAGTGFLTYLWNNGLTQQTISISGNNVGIGIHKYTVTVRDSNLCESKDSIIVEVVDCSSIRENPFEMIMSPNPAENFLIVNTRLPFERYSVFNMDGKRLISKTTGNQATKTKVDLRTLPPGNYILRIKDSEGRSGTKQFIKQ